jgi:hypothetical protein
VTPPLLQRATGTPLFVLPPRGSTPRRPHPPSPALPCLPCKRVPPHHRRAPISFLSPSPHFPLRVKHAAVPFTSLRGLLSESVTGASSKPSVDIIHCHRAPHVAKLLRSTSGAAFTSMSTALVPFSSLTSKSTPVSPSASTAPPPSEKRCCATPSTTSSMPDPPGEPRHHPSCSATSPHHPHTHAVDRATWEPSASPGHPRHRVDSHRGDHATAAPAATGQSGHHRVAMGCVNRPPPSLEPSREQATVPHRVQPWAKSRPSTVPGF